MPPINGVALVYGAAFILALVVVIIALIEDRD